MAEFTIQEANRRIAELKKGNAELLALNTTLTTEMTKLAARVDEIATAWGVRPPKVEKIAKADKPTLTADDLRKALDDLPAEERARLVTKAALQFGREIRPGKGRC